LVDIHTDSQYLRNGILSWINQWKRNGWRTADRKPVRNIDLWQRLDALLARHRVRWHWVRGHSGHALNQRADELAREGLKEARQPPGQSPPAASADGESCLSKASPPDTSTLPGASSMLSFFTTPSSISIA